MDYMTCPRCQKIVTYASYMSFDTLNGVKICPSCVLRKINEPDIDQIEKMCKERYAREDRISNFVFGVLKLC